MSPEALKVSIRWESKEENKVTPQKSHGLDLTLILGEVDCSSRTSASGSTSVSGVFLI